MEECFFFQVWQCLHRFQKNFGILGPKFIPICQVKNKIIKEAPSAPGFLIVVPFVWHSVCRISLSLIVALPVVCVFVCVKVCSLVRACICMQHPTRHPGSESLAAASALRGLIGARGSCGLTDVNTPQLLISDLWKQTVPWRSDRCSPPRVLHQRARSTWPLTRSMCPDALPPAADPGMPLYLAGLRKAITVLTDQLKRKICSHDCYRTGFKKKKFIEKV